MLEHTVGTGTDQFDHRTARSKPGLAGGQRQALSDSGIVQFGHSPALGTDQELTGMRMLGVGAADEGMQTLDLVRQPLFEQEVQGPIDGRRSQSARALAHGLQDFISTERTLGRAQDRQHPPPLWCESDAALSAERLGLVEHSLQGITHRRHGASYPLTAVA